MHALFYLVIIILYPITLLAEPVADWIDIRQLPETWRDRSKSINETICISDKSDIQQPIYPEADFWAATSGRYKPDCELSDKWHMYGTILLLTMQIKQEVIKWYRNELQGYNEYKTDDYVIFTPLTVSQFIHNKHYRVSEPHVLIKDVSTKISQAGSYRTVIELVPDLQE